ncbi:MAG TPA: hypothetical protein VFG69_12885, partial [Nannocystaceae bacterium]|nr:hypothetical protein [Nannocystaceae bacterium]
DAKRPWAERRRIVFQQWDDCAEPLPKIPVLTDAAADEIAKLRAEAAADARATIEAFVRRHARPGTSRAYAPGELEALNARRRTAVRFDPYAESRP